MSRKNRLLMVSCSLLVALLLGFSWVNTTMAFGGDGDGSDGDQVIWPLLIIAGVVLIGTVVYLVVQYRSRSHSQNR